uniref:Uncharacterized protein n=1 Tax=Lactuca sativa TaxID=4236 RepID=A0A9R1VH98_LACSA|nr:hypothetical protein LSAT_V11C500252730 [Lactuca sativa]
MFFLIVLYGKPCEIFRNIVFGYLLDFAQLQGDVLLFHKMFLHQLWPDAIVSPYDINRLYFKLGDTKMVYGPEEFCLITGFNFGEYPKMIGKKFRKKNLVVKICDLKSYILNQPFLAATDDDTVRVCLIYVLCESFLGKEANDCVLQD